MKNSKGRGGAARSTHSQAADPTLKRLGMSPEDRLNSALNLLFLLAQAYYKILESVVSSEAWFCSLDLELNESYLWTVTNLENLLANHEDLRDFPEPFEPIFPDLYPSTILDVEWQDMVAPEAEKFLSTVQRYTRSKGMHIPEPSTPAWTFVELFRPSAEQAVEQARTYCKRMRDHARRVFAGKADAVGTPNRKTDAVMSSVFISYSWDSDIHREWVRRLAERLRADGVDVSIDRWETVPGDQLPAFMERAIRENKFIVIICTARYKRRSDAREGGVGYEGDIMTGEALTSQNNRKFIPVLRDGAWREAAPSWLVGKYYINLTGNPYSERDYEDLVRTLLEIRETAPPIGKPFATINSSAAQHSVSMPEDLPMEFQDLKITRVIVEDITEPRNDGTAGSSLYSIPFALSASPPPGWEDLFLENWNHPSQFTTMHRPGIASISGATVILDGTTIEEVERYHRDTLQLAVAQTNQQYRDLLLTQNERLTREEARRQEHRKRVENASKRIKFD